MQQTIQRQKSWISYVPYMAISCFVILTVGMIVWAVGTTRALSSTNTLLGLLQVDFGTLLGTAHDSAIGAVVVCMLMATVMLLMTLGRTSLERKIDERGQAVCGTWLWLAVASVLSAIWWIIMFWMVFVIFGSCLWYAAAYTLEGALSSVLNVRANTPPPPSPFPPSPPFPFPSLPPPPTTTNSSSNGTSSAGPSVSSPLPPSPRLSPPGPPPTSATCPNTCFNLAYFSYATTVTDTCICDGNSIQAAQSAADTAARNLHLTVAGSFVMFVGCSFMLMVAVSGFATTKRERELLLRAQRHAAEAAASNMALGGMHAPQEYKETAPLMQAPHSNIQMQPPHMPQMMPPGMRAPTMARPPV